jgi:hypothetical protein
VKTAHLLTFGAIFVMLVINIGTKVKKMNALAEQGLSPKGRVLRV